MLRRLLLALAFALPAAADLERAHRLMEQARYSEPPAKPETAAGKAPSGPNSWKSGHSPRAWPWTRLAGA